MINMHSLDKVLFPGTQLGCVSIVFGDVREFLEASGSGFLGVSGALRVQKAG